MSAAVDGFISELLGSEFAEQAEQFRKALIAVDEEGDSNPSAAGFYETALYVISNRHHTLQERIAKLDELIHRKGVQAGTIRAIVGW
jgi:hypothetical protein